MAQVPAHFLTKLVILALGLATAPLYFGCSTPPGPPEPSEALFVGPKIALAPETESEQVIISELPTPGWEFTLDATREAYRKTNVFVTFRKPNPAFVYPQYVVTQRLATTVRHGIPIVVYAREVSFEDHSNDLTHHRVNLESPGVISIPPPQPPPAEASPNPPAK